MKRAIVIGASSGIGRQVAQLLLQHDWHVGLAARRIEALQELKCIAPDRIVTAKIDVTDSEATDHLLTLINQLGGMNLFFYAAGVGWQNPQLEEDKEMQTVETNALGFTRMVGTAFRYFANHTGGQIAVISSVAGTRGLGPAPAYSATKAMQHCYIESLEQLSRMRNLHINFTDIRPGFVETPLLRGNRFPMLMSSRHVAKHIIKAIYKRRHVVVIDWRWGVVVALWRCVPHWLWRKLKLPITP